MEDKTKIVEAFTEMAPRYEQVVDSELNRFWGWSYQGFVNYILACTPIQQQDIILDIATGTGVIPHHIEKSGHPASQMHGLDITLSMLSHARRRLEGLDGHVDQNLACASAMDMPYAGSSFTQVICGLASHHMDVKKLVNECQRVLECGGKITIGDVGGSNLWKLPGVKLLVRIVVFGYFILAENPARAWAEAGAVANVLSREDWHKVLVDYGFHNIIITKLESKYFWVPSPLLIKAEKMEEIAA